MCLIIISVNSTPKYKTNMLLPRKSYKEQIIVLKLMDKLLILLGILTKDILVINIDI